jgi:hypothetical protein
MTDLIIGAVTKYSYDKIEPWVNSIEKSGFTGKKALIVYDMEADVAKKLIDKDFTLFGFNKDSEGNFSYKTDFSIMVERFVHAWYFISKIEDKIDNVIWTDVRDVVFQTNPSEWLKRNMYTVKHRIVVGSENFRYKDEPWGKNNLMLSFGPMLYETIKENAINCAGVIAGEKQAVIDLFLNIFMLCRGSSPEIPGGGGPDQAALNILLSLEPYKSITKFCTTDESWVVHAGTTMPAILCGKGAIGEEYIRNPSSLNSFEKNMIGNDPVLNGDVVVNGFGEPYAILHQYDRVNQWASIIDKKHRG